MIDRILKTHEAIGKVFLTTSKAPQPFTVDEQNILLDLLKLLAPFETATNIFEYISDDITMYPHNLWAST